MWHYIARKILRNRLAILITIIVITCVAGYFASKIELSYEFARILPKNDPEYIKYNEFKAMFGEDGSVMVLGFQDPDLFTLQKFNGWYELGEKIKTIEGIQEVLSVAKLYNIHRNDSLQKFEFKPIVTAKPSTQQELDSLAGIITSLPFYEGLVFNKESKATVMAITFDKKNLDSKNRLAIVEQIKEVASAFSTQNNVALHYSGMPYIRSEYMRKIGSEMKLFLLLAIIVTASILLFFFRSFSAVSFSIIVVAIGVVWSLATIYLFGYKITVLSGLIPPLIIIIGVPNCIFFINKYHSELKIHGSKLKAVSRMISKVGLSLFLANVTTAIGFGVFYFTNSSLLQEFGVIAAINVMTTYLITLVFIPIMFSYLPLPSIKHTDHLDAKRINKVLDFVNFLVHNKRREIYIIVLLMTIVSFYGMNKIKVIGYVVDDLPQKDPIYEDLRFFEKNFNGVLPFEISVDTKKPNGLFTNNGQALYKIKALQKVFSEYKEFSKPLSVVEALKFSYQSYKGGDPKYYILPGSTELKKLSDYASSVDGKENKLQAFVDSTKQYTRVSLQMADVGSVRMKQLVKELQPKVDSIFDPAEYRVVLTGHSLMFLTSNDYLLKNLLESLIIAIVLIFAVGLVLFRSFRIIVLSKIPCLVPLAITSAIMGFCDINFKPSTILIFSIAFGISSDGTIYFLTRYRQELKSNKSISDAVTITIRETGISMIYTAIILFFGFAIFAASTFGGTVALGVLVSITLLIAMCSNLILLPALLLSLEKRLITQAFMKEPMLEILDEQEDIELDKLEVKKENSI